MGSSVPDPISYTRTFGVYHDFLLISEVIGYDEVALLAFALLLAALIIYILKPNFIVNFSLSDILNIQLTKKYFIFFPTALVINLFQNWGYKFIFNFFLIYIIYISTSNINRSFLALVILTQTTYYLIGYGFINNFINGSLLISSKLFFYLFFIQTIYYYILSIKKINTNYNF